MLQGVWFDGHSSQARPVRLHLSAPGVLEVDTGNGFRTQWPVSEVRVSPRLAATPRILRRAGYGQIECPDSPEIDAWFAHGASRIETLVDWAERRKFAILLAAAATLAFIAGLLHFGIPALAQVVAARTPPVIERQITNQAVALLERMYLEPSRLPQSRRSELQAAFARLMAGEPRHEEMQLQMVAGSIGPNAFTLPDGRIFVSDELVAFAQNDEELLAVLAHEAGHHRHRHGMRNALESSIVFLATGVLFGDVSGSSVAVAIPATLLSSGFSRGHEREADAYAFDLLKRRGYSPLAFAHIMTRLMERDPVPDQSKVMGYLSTHPPSPERIRAAQAAAGQD
ncbi:MAG: M48 family metallopeptidase [Longimicrobiales bacterium]